MDEPLVKRFAKEPPKQRNAGSDANLLPDPIAGCSATRLISNEDERGFLIELLTTRDRPIEPIVHVYQVHARPGSLRAWIYHRKQFDRLAFTDGQFKVVLADIREDSPTYGRINEIVVGEESRVLLTIAPLVAHAVQNVGEETSVFVNLPTRAYEHADPDKYRLSVDSKLFGYAFDR